MADIIAWLQANAVLVLSVALGVSEALALIPALQSNSILQAVVSGIKSLLSMFSKK